MSNIVNKLIHNTLVQRGNVSLPYLGSLHTEGDPKRVVFDDSVSSLYPSIIDVIAAEGGVSREEAERLYGDWLSSAKEADGSIFIDGVGRITPRQVEVDSSFNRALNGANAPLPTATLKKRKKNGWLWWLLVVVLLLGGAAAWYFTQENDATAVEKEVVAEEVAEEECLNDNSETPSRSEAKCATHENCATQKIEQGKEVATSASKPTEKPSTKVVTKPEPGKRYNVAVGVFSIRWNAEDCARKDPLGIGSENYLIGRFPSDLWVVIAHSTNDWREAEKMRKEYKKAQKDVWVYRRW